MPNWPTAGSLCAGFVRWCQPVRLSVCGSLQPYFIGEVRANTADWDFVDANSGDPLRFCFASATGFDPGESVVFDVVQKPFGLAAESVQPMMTKEQLGEVVIRLHRKAGAHSVADELQRQLDGLWQ